MMIRVYLMLMGD